MTSNYQTLRDLKGFKLVHLNCRSVYNKLNQIGILFDGVDIVCLSETWLHELRSDAMLNIPGKKIYRWNRSNGRMLGVTKSRGGGLACYINSELSSDCHLMNSACTTTPDIELQVIKVSRPAHKLRYVINLYRPPYGNIESFFSILENIFLTHNFSDNEVWVLGDFNIDYLKRSDKGTKMAIEFARIYGLRQLVQSATHLTAFSASCIDLIFTNAQFVVSTGVLTDVISDHFPIYACVKKKRERRTYTTVLGRSYTKYDKQTFKDLLTTSDWTSVYNETDPNIIWDLILDQITSHLSVMCPVKPIKITTNKPFWLSHHIFESINDRNRLFKLAKANQEPASLLLARQACNRTNKLINAAKEDYIKESLDRNRSDPKKFWRIINNNLIKTSNNTDPISLYDGLGNQLSHVDSCTYMNEFLTNFSKTLHEQFDADPVPGNVANNYYNKPTLLNEYEITNIDIINIIKDIDQHKGSGIDFLPTFILLDAFASIPFVIAHLMNQSLLTGIFPEKWSVATVTPIPKGGDLHNVGNWRPISILPLPGKILEKICTSFLLNELTDNEIISEFQFGFCRGLSTSHAIFHVVKQIIEGINSRNVTVSLYLDFARAFDSVNYRLLLAKLHDMGISLMLIRWIKGYLINRRMCTKMNGHTSTVLPLLSGVPQGSIVGPILFLCYINDIVKVAYDCEIQISLYADDAVLYCTNSDRNILLHRMQHALDSVSAWCIANRINLNTKKTKYCIYGSRNLMSQYDLALYFSDILLQRCKQYNYLGVF